MSGGCVPSVGSPLFIPAFFLMEDSGVLMLCVQKRGSGRVEVGPAIVRR